MIVNGREIAEKVYEEIGKTLKGKRVCFVMFKDSPETRKFVELKCKAAERLKVRADVVERSVPDSKAALDIIANLIEKGYDGIVVQLPLSEGLDRELVLDVLPTELDIDVLGEEAKYKYESGKSYRIPPVAGAVEEIFIRHNVVLENKKVLVLGYGKLVGESVSLMLYRKKIQYDIADLHTPPEEREKLLKEADIIITGIGEPHYLKPEMLKRGVVLIDAGSSEQAGKLVGDADPACAEVASLFTPVPGGVGPLTIAALFRNLLLQ
jgi:5,10-methylene-tetrahydrofolate dehydrogenase/methenyl tetrahydrofolate cyclohydrolase